MNSKTTTTDPFPNESYNQPEPAFGWTPYALANQRTVCHDWFCPFIDTGIVHRSRFINLARFALGELKVRRLTGLLVRRLGEKLQPSTSNLQPSSILTFHVMWKSSRKT